MNYKVSLIVVVVMPLDAISRCKKLKPYHLPLLTYTL